MALIFTLKDMKFIIVSLVKLPGKISFQLHHAVDNMYKTIRFILEVSAEHRDYNNTSYYNNYIHII